MNNQARLLLAILPALALPLPATGNNEKIARRAVQSTLERVAEVSRSMNAPYPYNVIVNGADAGEDRISVCCRNPNKARPLSGTQSGSQSRGRAPRSEDDQTLEVPRAVDPKRSATSNEFSATSPHNLNSEPPGAASDPRESFPGIVRPIGTLRDYENEAKNQTPATVCEASQWWWTSGVAVCVPAPRSHGAAAYRGP
jgi:hypothetical protein